MRDPQLQDLLDALGSALTTATTEDEPGGRLARDLMQRWQQTAPQAKPTQLRQAVCDHIDTALACAVEGGAACVSVAQAFRPIAGRLGWYSWLDRPHGEKEGLRDGCGCYDAHAEIVGGDGLEQRDDLLIGVSLIAPGCSYPDHRHPPEEVYYVFTPGEWRNDDTAWHAPGPGGTVFNPPDIVHAMRAAASAPLLAIWCLPGAI